jgi:hypothetical protein
VCVCVCVVDFLSYSCLRHFFLFFSAFLLMFYRLYVSRSIPFPSHPVPCLAFISFFSPFPFFPTSSLPLFLNFSLCLSHSILSLSPSSLYPTIYLCYLLFSSLLSSPSLSSPSLSSPLSPPISPLLSPHTSPLSLPVLLPNPPSPLPSFSYLLQIL